MVRKRNCYLITGLLLTGCLLAFIAAGLLLSPYTSTQMNAAEKLDVPGFKHLMGADQFGRDILSRVLDGAITTLVIAVSTVLIGAVAGTLIGALTGYFGGWLDESLMRVNDAVTAFPSLLLALVLISLLGPGKYNVIAALGILFIPSFARIVRSEFIRCKNREFVQSARIMGAGHFRIMFVHILPNTVPVLLSSVTIGFNNAVLAESGMSYLGIGVQPPDASLGRMLSESQTYLFSAPWYAVFPGLAIILLILGMSLIGEGLRERINVL